MNRGLYISAAGAVAQMTRMDTIANNLANVDTVGFKKDLAVFRSNQPAQVVRTNDTVISTPIGNISSSFPIGSLSNGAIHEENVINYEEGMLKETGHNFDFAIIGEGFFTVETPQGIRYTRNGSFTRNSNGEIVTMQGYRLLGQNGPIQVGDSIRIELDEDGIVYQDGDPLDTLRISIFQDKSQLTKEGDSFFTSDILPQQPAQVTVRQGMLEGSNVQAVKEMLNLIEANRAYELSARLIQVNDALLGMAVGDVGRSGAR